MTFFCGKQFHPWILFRALFTFARLAVYFSKILMQVSHHENFEKGKFALLKSEGKPWYKKGHVPIILQWNYEARQSDFTFVLNMVDVISMINKVIDNENLWSIW